MTSVPVARPASQPARPERPTLRLVPAPTPPRRAPFVALIAVLLVGGLLALLGLNTLLNQGAFALQDLQRRAGVLAGHVQQLTEAEATAESPDRLAARASALGMVPAADPQLVRLPDGRVVARLFVPVPPPARPRTTAPSRPAARPTPRAARVASPAPRRTTPRPAAAPTARPR